MINFHVKKAFAEWCDSILERRRQRVAVSRAMARLLNRILTQAFLAWAGSVEAAKGRRNLLFMCVAKFANAVKSAAFNGWLECVYEERRLRGLAAKVRGILGLHDPVGYIWSAKNFAARRPR